MNEGFELGILFQDFTNAFIRVRYHFGVVN